MALPEADRPLRLGCGAAGEPDRPAAALDVVLRGEVDFVCFDTLAERTLAGAQLRRVADPETGYDLFLRERVGALIAPARRRGVRLAGNMGAANPRAAARVLAEEASRAGEDSVTIGVVTGDDILAEVLEDELPLALWDQREDLAELRGRLVSANVYLGFRPLLEALDRGAEIVVTGRGADVAPYMAAAFHRWRWDVEDHDALARAAVIGHLLECGRCVTGACYAEPAFGRLTPDPANIGMPIGEVGADGSAVITKVPGSGGLVTRGTCAEQLIHEIGDPSCYLTPDVAVDMTRVTLEEVGVDRVLVRGARGGPPPSTYKVLLGVDDGWIAEGEVSFAGLGAATKARGAAAVIASRLARAGISPLDYREDVIGADSVSGRRRRRAGSRSTCACGLPAACAHVSEVDAFEAECQDLWWAPGVGAGGVRTDARRVLGMYAASVPRELIEPFGDAAARRWGVGERGVGCESVRSRSCARVTRATS